MPKTKATERSIEPPARVRGARRKMTGVPYLDSERRAVCPQHNDKPTTEYVGENAEGWVFRCVGWSKEEAKANARAHGLKLFEGEQNIVPNQWHYFTAVPAVS